MQVNVAGIRRNIKNLAHNYSDPQVKVREATSNDPWGPSATIMAEIADLTYNVVAFSEIMQMIWKRLNDHGKNWRHVYKALILLEYLIKTGTEKVAQQCKENIYAIQTLKEFQYFEEGKDQGLHVREKAKTLVSLLKDDERLKNERTKALKAKERFAQHASGFGSDGSIDGPTLSHRDSPSWRAESEASRSASELEYVRPQTVGEEELQLQLAMAMSREEAEQEEAKRRSDDVRLQLALSQSEQDFKKQGIDPTPQQKQAHASHLMDLLDISLGAASISGPSQASDPWGMPISDQKPASDPWGRASPATDPWNTNTGAISRQPPIPSLAGASNVENWVARNHSPSVASGSSTEDWLQLDHRLNAAAAAANGNGNGNVASNAPPLSDPWLSKQHKPEQPDPWLTKAPETNADAWQPSKSAVVDPWAPSNIGSRPSPIGAQTSPNSDYDEFDVISNRAKTQNPNNNNNNNTSNALLDEMDPLAAKNNSTRKTPQSFLGENSALVNLDQLIKTTNPTNPGQAAYNPFGDLNQPPKTNLFQQQMQPVPSINQLKQSPFPVILSQDPWAPVNNSSQYATNVDGHNTTHDDQYDANANYDDVFDTKHVVQAIEDIHITTNPTYNNNYKLYYDDEYHDFNQISQKCVDNERNNITNNNRNNTTGNTNNNNNNNNAAASWLNPEMAASNPFLS
ncbi:epsin-1 isoform X4 [Sitodiplosis mosellana]|nr:epsin-1 isoform X4 [Sitodiplosis mosellana]XP_055322237.1 epsin-1 isoform X4 [Sitodiplosis mosellana]XP_055322238.1 epsin-1 isoform X4 [Sitodiplosis mosellana]XP_055322239.1 epsin-1 isoform X4 [Sitodiplosis mosellana]